MRMYYEARGLKPFDYIPLSFHVKNGVEDVEYLRFEENFKKNKLLQLNKNIWIIKPGENTNQGRGIVVCNMIEQVKDIVRQTIDIRTGIRRTYIIQKYLERPLLIHRRKFDIR
jgi:tubulin--tyrosine ligase